MSRTHPPKSSPAPLFPPNPISANKEASENGANSVSSGTAPEAHPLAHLAGKYNDDPIWDNFAQAMQETRRKMDAKEEAPEPHRVCP